MTTIDFILGEKRKVMLKVVSIKSQPFSIQSTSANLIYNSEQISLSGCTLDDDEKIISVVLQPEKIGRYTLEISYCIADEIFKERLAVNVT